ncbi:MAG: hypothetical protein HY741_09070 [Chloroflexi bacterium]|nr:hypothetical protein [Chloroflexota bacterium]
MSMQLLEKIIQESDALTVQEQLRLAAHLLEKARAAYPPVETRPRRKWREIRGIVPYPLAGEDAQAWVSRTRRESDERREAQLVSRSSIPTRLYGRGARLY